MEPSELRALAQDLVARERGAALLSVGAAPLRGGISAAHVATLRAAYLDAGDRIRSASWVVKELAGPARREAGVYRWLARHGFPHAPRLVAALPEGDRILLVLERVVAAERWPWRDTARAEDVLRAIATLHEAPFVYDDSWDYEGELSRMAAWIQSVGCWEPLARLRHDTLLAAYLGARGRSGGIPGEVREAYWLAGASNALAGAVLHHTGVASDPAATRRARARAAWALHDWLRIIRRAAAVWGAAAPGAPARRTPPPGARRDPTGAASRTHSPDGTRSTARS